MIALFPWSNKRLPCVSFSQWFDGDWYFHWCACVVVIMKMTNVWRTTSLKRRMLLTHVRVFPRFRNISVQPFFTRGIRQSNKKSIFSICSSFWRVVGENCYVTTTCVDFHIICEQARHINFSAIVISWYKFNLNLLEFPDEKALLTVCLGIESTAPPGIRMSSRGGPPPSITELSWRAAVDNAALNRKYNQYLFRKLKVIPQNVKIEAIIHFVGNGVFI